MNENEILGKLDNLDNIMTKLEVENFKLKVENKLLKIENSWLKEDKLFWKNQFKTLQLTRR